MKLLRRWLDTGGEIGSQPLWHRVIAAARTLRVPPWELLSGRSRVFWIFAAEESAAAEAWADRQRRLREGKGRR